MLRGEGFSPAFFVSSSVQFAMIAPKISGYSSPWLEGFERGLECRLRAKLLL
jgi:hypothetical protein